MPVRSAWVIRNRTASKSKTLGAEIRPNNNGRPKVGAAIARLQHPPAPVSRSFYLSISILPKPLRDPVALGYLLARASDTIADTAELPREGRA